MKRISVRPKCVRYVMVGFDARRGVWERWISGGKRRRSIVTEAKRHESKAPNKWNATVGEDA